MSVTCDDLVRDIQGMFNNINEGTLNYWGITNRKEVIPLGCLKCNKVMRDFREFMHNGPMLGSNKWFCENDAPEYFQKILKLEKLAKKEGKDFHLLYEKALQPLRQREVNLKKYADKWLSEEQKTKSWAMLPFLDLYLLAKDKELSFDSNFNES